MKWKYNDSDPLHTIEVGYNEETRFLDFHSTPLEVDRLQEALDIIGQYNEFDSKKVGKAILDTSFARKVNDEGLSEFVVGRESSPVVYIIPKSKNFLISPEVLEELREQAVIDEVHVQGDKIRLWWD